MRQAKRNNVDVLKHQLEKNIHLLKDKAFRETIRTKYLVKPAETLKVGQLKPSGKHNLFKMDLE